MFATPARLVCIVRGITTTVLNGERSSVWKITAGGAQPARGHPLVRGLGCRHIPRRGPWTGTRAAFPQWGAYAPGLAPVFAVSGTYVLMGILGIALMRLVAGPPQPTGWRAGHGSGPEDSGTAAKLTCNTC